MQSLCERSCLDKNVYIQSIVQLGFHTTLFLLDFCQLAGNHFEVFVKGIILITNR